jgi:hypothetical protein
MIAAKIRPQWDIWRPPAAIGALLYTKASDGAHSPDEARGAGAPQTSGGQQRPQRRWLSSRRFVVGIALGMLLGVGLVIAVLFWDSRDTAPRLTETDYDAAVKRWEVRGPKSYNLDLELFGNRPGPVHVEVRDGSVTHMTRDGVEPKRKPTWEYWTVPGQLDTIGQELEKAADPVVGFHAPAGSRVVQRARFDLQYGYPVEYQRIILGSELELRWRVTRFEVLAAKPDPPAR